MKCTIFFFGALAVCSVRIVQTFPLQEDSMDTFRTQIDVKNPSWGLLSSGILKSHLGIRYKANREKTLILSAPKGYSMVAAIRILDLRPNNQDSLKLFAVNSTVKPFTYTNEFSYENRRYDSYEDKNTFFAPNGQLGVTFNTGPNDDTWRYDGFELIYTVQANWSLCKSENFRCGNGRCISSALTCDGHNHCEDRSDQKNCFFPSPAGRGRIAGIVAGVVFFLIAVVCVIYIVVRRATRSKTEVQTIIRHPPPTNLSGYPPSYPEPGTYYPPPPPPYSQHNQGIPNPGYH